MTVTRRALGRRRAGHTGTLDPFATGLLVVLTDRATRLARFIEAEEKCYLAEIRLGVGTSTDDATGEIVATEIPATWPAPQLVEEAIDGMVGSVMQLPPRYSAKKIAGVRSYRLAREGKDVELSPVPVTISKMDLVACEQDRIELRATVGKGTYLRAIARDLGLRLGLPAHCAALRRTRVGRFRVEDALGPRDVTTESLLSPAEMVAHLPFVHLSDDEIVHIAHGRRIPCVNPLNGPTALLARTDGRLVAIAQTDNQLWQPMIVMEPAA